MPLLKRKHVPLVPFPKELEDGSIAPDTEVFQLKATGEIFLRYEDYAERMKFYLEKIFSCEYTGKSGLDYFAALDSEQKEAEKTQRLFPARLKSKVLKACQFQVEGRLENMVDLVYERFDRRFFLHDRVLLDDALPGQPYKQQYGGIIRRIVPSRARLDELLDNPDSPYSSNIFATHDVPDPNGEGTIRPTTPEPEDYEQARAMLGRVTIPYPDRPPRTLTVAEMTPMCHTFGCRLEVPTAQVEEHDPASGYLYSVQLMSGVTFCGGPIIEVYPDKLHRDRICWNKALVRKFLKEALYRDAAVGSPWQVKQKYIEEYGITTQQPADQLARSVELREDLLRKRKKPRADKPVPVDEDGNELPPTKSRRKRATGGGRQEDSSVPIESASSASAGGSGLPRLLPAPPKDDESASPLAPGEPADSSLRDVSPAPSYRAGTSPAPAPAAAAAAAAGEQARATPPFLPAPHPLRKNIKYPIEDLELDPTTVFDGRVLNRKHMALPDLPKKPLPHRDLPVPQDQFERFMNCWNFLQIFGSALAISPFTLDDFTQALVHHSTVEPRCALLGEMHCVLASSISGDAYTVLAPGTGVKASVESIPVLAATVLEYDDGMSVEQRERWTAAALHYSRGWDKKARPRVNEGRRGWDVHLLGILTQKGGLETIPTLPTIFRHLFTDENSDPDVDVLPELDGGEGEAEAEADVEEEQGLAEQSEAKEDVNGSAALSKENGDMEVDKPKPEGKGDVKDGLFADSTSAAKAEDVTAGANGDDTKETTVGTEGEKRKTDKTAELINDKSINGVNAMEAEGAAPASTEAVDEEDDDEDQLVSPVYAKPTRKWTKAQAYGCAHPNPERRYLSLPISAKLDILTFLVNMNLGTKPIKKYLDDAELRLTEERKTRADIKKERKELQAERAIIDPSKHARKKAANAAGDLLGVPGADGGDATPAGSAAPSPLLAPSSLAGEELGDMTTLSAAPSERDPDESVLDDVAPASRRTSSSPISAISGSEADSPEKRSKGAPPADNDAEDDADKEEIASDDDAGSDAPDDREDELDGDDELVGDEHETMAEVASDVDELASTSDEEDEAPVPAKKTRAGTRTRARASQAMDLDSDGNEEEDEIDDEEEEDEGSEAPALANGKGKGRAKRGRAATGGRRKGVRKAALLTRPKKSSKAKKAPAPEPVVVDRKTQLAEELKRNLKQEELFERDFRRHKEVARITPLGKDRFHHKYWWFDGIGPQQLVGPDGQAIYGTGRLFVQGPSEDDWKRACYEFGGEAILMDRRRKEEGHEELLGIDEWAFYDDAQTIETLLAWLNTKGIREAGTRSTINKWKRYILGGVKARQADLASTMPESDQAAMSEDAGAAAQDGTATETVGNTTRVTRGRATLGTNSTPHYLTYENTLAAQK